MSLDYTRLGDSLHTRINQYTPDEATINRLGDAMYNKMLEVEMNQDSIADGSLGRLRMRKVAEAMLDEFFNPAGRFWQLVFRNVAAGILKEIADNAEIFPLATTSTPNDGVGHIHNPITVKSKGKIR